MASPFARFVRVENKKFTAEIFPAENGEPAFTVECELLPAPQRQRMGKQYRLGRDDSDPLAFSIEYVSQNVIMWDGLTPTNFARLSTNMVPLSDADRQMLAERYNNQIPFDEETLKAITKVSPTFVDRIMTRLRDVEQQHTEAYSAERNGAEKNSSGG
jgi:hypothetical protein